MTDQLNAGAISETSGTLKMRHIIHSHIKGVILVKNHFFILLHKFNLYNLINDSLKFQISITVM